MLCENMYDTDDICTLYAHVRVGVDVRYARMYDLYIFVSLYHLDLERYSGISRDTTLYQNPPILSEKPLIQLKESS